MTQKILIKTSDLIVIRDDMQKQIDEFDVWAEAQSQLDPMMVTGLDEKKEDDK